MLPFCLVHVAQNPGHAQLMAGDVVMLERQLPQSAVVKRFQIGQRVQLTAEETLTLLAELRRLPLAALDVSYHRSAMHPEHVINSKDMVMEFIAFLVSEVRTLSDQ